MLCLSVLFCETTVLEALYVDLFIHQVAIETTIFLYTSSCLSFYFVFLYPFQVFSRMFLLFCQSQSALRPSGVCCPYWVVCWISMSPLSFTPSPPHLLPHHHRQVNLAMFPWFHTSHLNTQEPGNELEAAVYL